jgi:hypothetical protein
MAIKDTTEHPTHLQQLDEERLEAPLFAEGRTSRKSGATSLRKPLPGLPTSKSSPILNAKTSANLRQMAISSSASSSNSNLAPPAQIYSKPASSTSDASENWTAPEDAEGAYIRKTYAHFDASGIKGDGLVEGKEWTRERGARAAWDASESSSRGEPLEHLTPPSDHHDTLRAKGAARHPSPLSGNSKMPRSSSRDMSRHSKEGLNGDVESMTPDLHSLSVQDSFNHSSSSLGTHSVESLHNGMHKKPAREESDYELEAERKELMKNVDR